MKFMIITNEFSNALCENWGEKQKRETSKSNKKKKRIKFITKKKKQGNIL